MAEEGKKPTIEELMAELAEAKDGIEKLRAKNDELIKEKRKARDGGDSKVSEVEAKLDEANDRIAAMERDHKKALSTATKTIEELTGRFSAKSAAYDKLVRDDAITRHIAEVGVKKEFLPAVHALLKDRVIVDQETGVAFAVVKDKDDKEIRKPVADYVKDWAGGEEGKAYVVAPVSSGGGAQGSGGAAASGGTAKTMKRADFERLDPAAKSAFSKEHGTLTE